MYENILSKDKRGEQMKYIAMIDLDERPTSCNFVGCSGRFSLWPLGSTSEVLSADECFIGKWIPVSERLPEREYENYLVSTSEGEVDIGAYDSTKGWSLCDVNGIYFPQYKGIEIVAWMPLPEAYKESD